MRVLAHDPVDPLNPTATPRLWPARAPIRLNMRVSGSPYIERTPFEADDVTAFVAAGGAWQVVAGAMTPAAPSTTAAQFAIFGDPSWEQLRLLTSVTPGGGQAGIASRLLPQVQHHRRWSYQTLSAPRDPVRQTRATCLAFIKLASILLWLRVSESVLGRVLVFGLP